MYRPGCLEHYVLKSLRNDPDFVPELDFVMEKDGKIIGQNVFVRTVIEADDGRDIPIMTMGPICISPELKRQALKLQQEQNKQERKAKSRGQKLAEAERLFELRQQQKKATHRCR